MGIRLLGQERLGERDSVFEGDAPQNHAPYELHIRDSARELIARIERSIGWAYTRRLMEATEVTFTMPRELVSEIANLNPLADKLPDLRLASFIEIWDALEGRFKASGRLSRRSIGSDTVTVTAFTDEILLTSHLLPRQYGLVFENRDLADVARELLYSRHTLRKKSQADWSAATAKTNVDTATIPGLVMLAKAGLAYRATGSLILRFNKSDVPGFVAWERIRWAGDLDDVVSTAIEYRANGTGSWVGPFKGGIPDQIGVEISDKAATFYEVRVTLTTTDTTTPDDEDAPTVLGHTPFFFALEMIAKTQGRVGIANIPAKTGEVVKGIAADEVTALEVLRDACAQTGWEFEVIRGSLHLVKQLGRDRTKDFLLKTDVNTTITVLESDDSELVNVLTAHGPGGGINSLIVTLTSPTAATTQYGPYPRAVEFPTAADLADLTAQAQEYLDAHDAPLQRFEVAVSFPEGKEPEYSLGDTVRVADPESGVITTARILEERREYGSNGLTVNLYLDTPRHNLVDEVLDTDDGERGALDLPAPSNPRAYTIPGGLRIVASWQVNSRAQGVEIHLSTLGGFTPAPDNRVYRGNETSVSIPGLLGNVRYYGRMRAYDAEGKYSEYSVEFTGLAGSTTDIGPGTIGLTELADSLIPPLIVDGLPALPDGVNYPAGSEWLVFNTQDGKLYKLQPDGAAWKPLVNSDDFEGQITETQIAPDSISTPKLQANSISSAKIQAASITASKIATDAVTAGTIAAGAIRTRELAADAVTADKIAAGVLTLQNLENLNQLIVEGNGFDAGGTPAVYVNGVKVAPTNARRGHTYVLLEPDLTVRYTFYYDTYASAAERTALTNRLNSMSDLVVLGNESPNLITCLFSYDAIGVDDALKAAIMRTGGTSACKPPGIGRYPYALIGRPNIGQGKGVEQINAPDSKQPARVGVMLDNAARFVGAPQGLGQYATIDAAVNAMTAGTSRADGSGFSTFDGAGNLQFKTGNIAGLPGVPAGFTYGGWGRLGAGLFIGGAVRSIASGIETFSLNGFGSVVPELQGTAGASRAVSIPAQTPPPGRKLVALVTLISGGFGSYFAYAGAQLRMSAVANGTRLFKNYYDAGQTYTNWQLEIEVFGVNISSTSRTPSFTGTFMWQLFEMDA